MEFEEYLTAKKIDKIAFREADPERFGEWKQVFQTMHPESFTAQKKFLINEIRRRYHLNDQAAPAS